MDNDVIKDRFTTLILLFITILTTISAFIPKIQEALLSLPDEYKLPALIVALIVVAIVGVFTFRTSEQRSQNAYDQGLYEPVPPDTTTSSTVEDTEQPKE